MKVTRSTVRLRRKAPTAPQEANAPVDDNPLFVYVWDTVFTDYSSGMAVAIARSLEEAINLAADRYCGTHSTEQYKEQIRQELRREPHELYSVRPLAFTVSGGG